MTKREVFAVDVYRTAKLLINEHSEEAPIEAAMRADEFLTKGNLEGQATWLRVLAAVKELQATKPEIGVSIH